LGAFGYLGGTTVERDAIPNAGFWDQRAIFEWIQEHIHLVNGDKDDVSVWGESAGMFYMEPWSLRSLLADHSQVLALSCTNW
jgi:carboxylesterase type B